MARSVEKNDDLLEEILIRIPARRVVQFKPVSKRWYNLLSSSRFARRHSSIAPRTTRIVLLPRYRSNGGRVLTTLLNGCNFPNTHTTEKLREIDLLDSIQSFYNQLLVSAEGPQYTPDPESFKILDASNGLFLFFLTTVNSERKHYLVSNPFTKEYAELPALVGANEHELVHARLVFDPAKTSYYKVVAIIKLHKGDAYHQIHVYTSEKRTWKVSDIFKGNTVMLRTYSLLSNNSTLLCWPTHYEIDPGYTTIFNLESLSITALNPLPPSPGHLRYHYFGESRGYLYLVQGPVLRYNDKPYDYTLWEMMGAQGSWMEKFRFTMEGRVEKILHIHRKDEQELQMFLVTDYMSSVVYCRNLNSDNITKPPLLRYIGDFDSIRGSGGWWDIISCTPTLFPLRISSL